MIRRKRLENVRIFNNVTRSWSHTSLAAIMASYNTDSRSLSILGHTFDAVTSSGLKDPYVDEGNVVLMSRGVEDGLYTYLQIPESDYRELTAPAQAAA